MELAASVVLYNPVETSFNVFNIPSMFVCVCTGCPRRNGQNFGRVFRMLNYTYITQNTYIQS